jgi:hypothetical protein
MPRAKAKPDREPGWENRERIAAQQRDNRRRRRGTGATADWGAVDRDKLYDLVCCVTAANCAIQFGYTQDNGALVIRVVGDGEPFNEYIRPTEDVNLTIEGFIEDYGK